ncbi:MAG: hypothetical protein ACOCQ4_00010 [bacterium]
MRCNSGIDRNKYECWKFYEYEENRISLEIEKRNYSIAWTGYYNYGNKGNLISIKRKKGINTRMNSLVMIKRID